MEILSAQKSSQVLYCETPDDFFKRRPSRNVHAKCSVVVDELHDANGITLTVDHQRLFVVEGKHLRGFNVDLDDDRRVTDYASIDMSFPCDNVNPSPDKPNELLVACFPKPLQLITAPYPFAGHAAMIRKVDVGKKTQQPFKIDVNGSVVSGITGAFQRGPFTVAVSVYDGLRYMVCSDYTKI